MLFMTVIHALCIKISYQTFPHSRNHLRCTFQFVINISLINSTVGTCQLRTLQCVLQ